VGRTGIARAAVVALAMLMLAGAAAPSRVTADTSACDRVLSAEERALARLFETDRRQRRRVKRCDPWLAYAARTKALDMARRGYFNHTTPDREGPNVLVERAGYRLPSFYSHSRTANNVEVIVAGRPTADAAWKAWLGSRHHRGLALGLERFYVEQTDYGVGYAHVPTSRYKDYWVLMSARH
jgi:hypothetical protein